MVSTTRLPKPNKFIINNGTKDLEYEIAHNNKKERLWRKTKIRIQPGQGELVKHWDSWHSGMGWSRDESRDAEYAPPVYESGAVTATHRGFVYPELAFNLMILSDTFSSVDRITEIGDYIYVFTTEGAGIRVHKIDPSDYSIVYERTFSDWPAPAGQPAEFGGYLYVPSGGGVFKELTTVADDLTGAFLISGGAPTEDTFELAADTDDGYLYKYGSPYVDVRSSTAGVDQSTYLYVGQRYTGGVYSIDRGYLRYDTSAIDDGDTVFAAKLRLYLLKDYSNTDFTIQVRAFTWGAALAAADWRATPSDDTLVGSISTADLPAINNWVEIDIDTTAISLDATTEFYLISSRDDDDPGTAPTGDEYVIFEAREHAGAHAAQLLVSHGTAIAVTDNTANANVNGGTAFTVLGDNSDDVFYWGADSKFDGLYIDIVTACDTELTLDWEFWNGAAWTDIIGPETDGTSGFTESGWVTWAAAAQTDWAETTVNSLTGYFVRVKTATAATTWPTSDWTPPSDVWTDGPGDRLAWHLGTAGKLLWRVGDNADPPAHHVINSCATAPLTAGNWSDSADYVIGKPGRHINSLAEMGRWIYVGKEEGLIGSDTEGNQTNALDFVRNLIASTNCNDTIRWLGTLVTTHSTGLWQHTGVSSRPIGIEILESNMSVVKGGRYTALATAGEWLYAVYRVGTANYILAGRPGHEDEPPVVWHELGSIGAPILSLHISALTTNPRLYFGTVFGDLRPLYYITLARDGSPDPTDSNMTFQATTTNLDLPDVDWGMPGTPKHGHMVEIVTGQAKGTGGTVKVYYGWDGAALSTQLGSTITTATKTQCFWAGGNTYKTHWGYRPQIRIQLTGHATNVLRLEKVSLYCIARPRMEDGIETTIRIADMLDGSRTAKVAYDDLDALVNAGVYAVRDPDDPAGGTFYAIVHNIAPSKGEQLGEHTGSEFVTVTLRKVAYS